VEVNRSPGSFVGRVGQCIAVIACVVLVSACGSSTPANQNATADESGIGCHHVAAVTQATHLGNPTAYTTAVPAQTGGSPSFDTRAAAGSAAVAGLVRHELTTYTSSTYTHDLSVDPKSGVYNVDCSGWAGDLVRRVNCPAYAELVESANRLRQTAFASRCDLPDGPQPHGPYAEDFAALIAGVDTGQRSAGGHWARVGRAVDAMPGDILAYTLPPTAKDTGHVMVVNGQPSADQSDPTRVVVPIADSTVKVHGPDDSRNGNSKNVGSTGIGSGAVVLVVGPDGAPTNRFIWHPGDPYVNTLAGPVVVGRVIW
jgi:hypothetical protein